MGVSPRFGGYDFLQNLCQVTVSQDKLGMVRLRRSIQFKSCRNGGMICPCMVFQSMHYRGVVFVVSPNFISAKTGVMHAVQASKNRVSVKAHDLEFIHDYVKPHVSFVHLLGLKNQKFIMYLYSIYRIGSCNITIQPP